MQNEPNPETKPRSITFYVILGATLFVFIQSFRLLSPILLSFLLVMLITMAVTPFIMARGIEMHPLVVIFSMLLCIAAFGVLGVLVAAPVVAIVNICHDELYRKRYSPTITDADLDLLAKAALFED